MLSVKKELLLIYGASQLDFGLNRNESIKILDACVENNLLHFDVAPSYRWGRSELALGEYFGDDSRVRIQTKLSPTILQEPNPNLIKLIYLKHLKFKTSWLREFLKKVNTANRSSDGSPREELVTVVKPEMLQSLDRDAVLKEFSKSRERLKRKRIFSLLIHEPSLWKITDSGIYALEELKASGDIENWGLGSDTFYTPLLEGNSVCKNADILQYSYQDFSRNPKRCVDKSHFIHGVFKAAEFPKKIQALDCQGIVFSTVKIKNLERNIALLSEWRKQYGYL